MLSAADKTLSTVGTWIPRMSTIFGVLTNRMNAIVRWELLEVKRRAGPGAVEGDAGEKLSWLFDCGVGSGGAGGDEGGEEYEGEGDGFV